MQLLLTAVLRGMTLTRKFLLLTLLFYGHAVHAHNTLPGNQLKLSTTEGSITLASLKGKPVYLDFWASWCAPCRKSFPWMNKMQAQYAQHGLQILAVNLDKEPHLAAAFLEKTLADFTIAYDPEGALAAAFSLKAMPSSFLIDTQGRIVARHLGFKSEHAQNYESEIRALLNLSVTEGASL